MDFAEQCLDRRFQFCSVCKRHGDLVSRALPVDATHLIQGMTEIFDPAARLEHASHEFAVALDDQVQAQVGLRLDDVVISSANNCVFAGSTIAGCVGAGGGIVVSADSMRCCANGSAASM